MIEYGEMRSCIEMMSNTRSFVICSCGIQSDSINHFPIGVSLFMYFIEKNKNPPRNVRLSGGGNFSILL